MAEYLLWILVIAYLAHILEEYYLNWKEWVKKLTGMDMHWNDFFLINSAVIIYGICISMIEMRNVNISLTFPALMIINALFFHIVPTIISRKLSPGIFTSIILFIPLSIYTFYKVSKQYELSAKSLVIAIIGGAIVMMYPILLVKIRSKTS